MINGSLSPVPGKFSVPKLGGGGGGSGGGGGVWRKRG